MSDSVTALALVAGPTVKVLLDVLRMMKIIPDGWTPLLAVLGGVLVVICGMLMSGDYLSQRTIATAVLAGIWAGANAVGVTELSKRGTAKK